MREGIKSSKIVWDQAGIEELKRALAEPEIDEDEGDSEVPTDLDFPWEPRVVSQERVVGDGGDVVVNVTLGFDDIPDAEDYEVRVALLPDIVDLNPVLGPTWQVPEDAKTSGPLTFYSGWHTAVKMSNSTALILWLVASGATFNDDNPAVLKARTVSLDENMSLGTPYVVTEISGLGTVEPENMRCYTLSDGRIVIVIPKYVSGGLTGETVMLLLSSSGGMLDEYVAVDQWFFYPSGEIFNDKLILFDPNSDELFSYDFTGNTINSLDSSGTTTGLTGAAPTILANASHIFLLDQTASAARYWSITHTDGVFGTWAGPTNVGSPTFYPWEEDSYMRAIKTGDNEWIYHGTTPDGASEAWAVATFTVSGSTLSIGGIRKFDAPSGILGSGVFGSGHTWTIESGTGFYMGPQAANWLFLTADGKVGSVNEITQDAIGDSADLTAVQIFDLPLASTSATYRREWSMRMASEDKITGLTKTYQGLGVVPIPGQDGVLLIQSWIYDDDVPTDNYLGAMVWLPLE